MKVNITLLLAILLLLSCIGTSFSQNYSDQTQIAVIQIDTKGFVLEPKLMGNIARIELEKLKKFQVMDKYDVDYIFDNNDFNLEKCFGTLCTVEAGRLLKTDKMLTGSVEVIGESILVSLRIIDVGTGSVDQTEVMDFLNNKSQIQNMIGLTLMKMLDEPMDQNLLSKLTKEDDYESTINSPESTRLNLSGPRMGLITYTGEVNSILQANKSEGGFDLFPYMLQFGYQFEVKYLNEGDFQALFEFIPIITGLDQGKFIPSITILNGLRSNRMGLEFAFGPTFFVTPTADGYYDEEGDGKWHLEEEWRIDNIGIENPNEIVNRLDSRGDPSIDSGFVFGIGKTFKSGKLNIPVNVFFFPDKDGHRYGLSVGFNTGR